MQTPPKAVLVTGASSGIGHATAELLAARGFRVLAGLRRRGPGEPLCDAPPGAEAVELDVSQPADVARVAAQLERECPAGLFGLVNNAGVAPPAAVELVDVDEVRRVLEINTLAPLRLIQACLPLLRKARGRVVNMSSMNGTLAMPIVGAYSASKFALEALSDSLRIELRPWGISVSVIRPGQVRTAIFAKAGAALDERVLGIPTELASGYARLYSQAIKFNGRGANARTTPDAVARAVLKALSARRPKSRYLVGYDALGLEIAQEWLPTRLMDWIMAVAMGTNRPATNGEASPPASPRPTPASEPGPARPGTLRSS